MTKSECVCVEEWPWSASSLQEFRNPKCTLTGTVGLYADNEILSHPRIRKSKLL